MWPIVSVFLHLLDSSVFSGLCVSFDFVSPVLIIAFSYIISHLKSRKFLIISLSFGGTLGHLLCICV